MLQCQYSNQLKRIFTFSREISIAFVEENIFNNCVEEEMWQAVGKFLLLIITSQLSDRFEDYQELSYMNGQRFRDIIVLNDIFLKHFCE